MKICPHCKTLLELKATDEGIDISIEGLPCDISVEGLSCDEQALGENGEGSRGGTT